MKRSTLRAFGRDRRGNFAMIFGLSLIPLLGMSGLATDYAKSTLVKRRLELAIDSASLAAIRKSIDLINEGKTTQAEAIAAGEAEGRTYLNAQSSRLLDSALSLASVKITVSGATISSQADYAAGVPTVFARLIGVNDFQVQGRSSAAAMLPPYVDVHVLVDISQSMGIGATAVDQERIRTMQVRRFSGSTSNVDQNGCVFGCHIIQGEFKSNSNLYATKTTYEMVQENGARMRIDVVRDALQKLAKSLLENETKRYRLSVHTFHSTFETVLPLTADATTAAVAISKIAPSTWGGGTNAHVAFRDLNKVIATPGDGLTPAKATAITIVMTDGIEDTQMEFPEQDGIIWDPNFVYDNPYAEDWGGRIQSFDPAMCKPMKDRNIRVIAMNTKYLIPAKDTNPKFLAIRDWLYTYIEGNMAKCVSSKTDYYDASSPEDIDLATTQIISSIAQPIALTE
ncbi:hypothetical protein ASG43_15875 [Aureimonas sp. Leaf454]|uniref:pilus assembly protein n=1 Tax=Aureimonas sp. Leaf454 TaxID=1736381 RepID=UPI0006F23C6C|nr:pilus assembly protein [Aureimonas sp. Leaf454]KQT43012.1 hypothetical protein ASG43_15875 [Aureimonas sp. Leaf454]